MSGQPESDSIPPAGSLEDPTELTPQPARRPWGLWATLGWTVVCVALMLGVQIPITLAYFTTVSKTHPEMRPADLASDGLLLAIVALAMLPVVLGCLWVVITARRWPVGEYLALTWPTPREAFVSVVLVVLLVAAGDTTTHLLGRPVVPPWMEQTYKNAGSLPLLLLALLVAAPVMEESLFRGFLFRGVAASRLGPPGAVVISALAWSLLHVQYDVFSMGGIFVGGLFLGCVRQLTKSTLLTMFLHFLINVIATLEVYIKVHYYS